MNQTPPLPVAAPRRRDMLGPRLLAGLVLLLCLGLTGALWHSAQDDARQEAQADFDGRVRELVNQLAARMDSYTQVLQGMQGLFAASDDVSRTEFRHYMEAQQLEVLHPGMRGGGYIALVSAAERAAHVARVHQEGYGEYSLFPAGQRPLYAPVLYLEPFTGLNLRAFGFDEWSEPVRRAALEQARDSGRSALTGKLALLMGDAAALQPGFLMVEPVYRNGVPQGSVAERRAALRGWVFAVFRGAELLAGVGGERGERLDVDVYDGAAVAPAALLLSRAGTAAAAPAPADAAAPLTTLQKLSIGGHVWTLRISAPAGLETALPGKPQWLAATGLVLSVLVAALAWLLARSRNNAQAALAEARLLAGQLEAGQARVLAMAETAQVSQAMLRSILDATIDGILVDTPNGKILTANRRFRELWAVPGELDWQADGAPLFDHIALQIEPPAPLHFGLVADAALQAARRSVLRLTDGRVIEQFARQVQLGGGPARLWSFRDITERSQVEQRERTRRHMLELLATGAPLPTILEAVVLGIQAGNAGMLCSILLLDDEGKHLLTGAAPSLPAFYTAAIQGLPIGNGVGSCGTAAAIGSRVIVEDIRSHPYWRAYRDLAAQAGLESCWSEPIRSSAGKVLGTFAIYQRRPHRPSPSNIALIEEASHLAGIAIEHAQASIALRAGEARFRSLYDHAPVALWELDWSAARAALVELEHSGMDDLAPFLRANPSEVLRLAALVRIVDVNAAALAQVGMAAADLARLGGAGAEAKALGALSLAQVFDDEHMPSFAAALTALAQGAHFHACESRFRRLDGVARQNEVTLLVMPGHEHSLDFVIVSTLDITERKRMNDELVVLATTDFLTGLPNRRDFMARLADEHARLQRGIGGAEGSAVLMLDIDHFKSINDHHGHAAGDAMLRHLAALMREDQRTVDVLGRLGGEEFALLLPGTDLAAAGVYAERLRLRVAGQPLWYGGDGGGDGGAALAVTVSIGIAAMQEGDATYDTALIRADQALYRAKRGGRNRVEFAAAPAPLVRLLGGAD